MNPKSFLFNFWGPLQLGGFFISFPLPLRYLCATLILLLRIISANCRYPPLARFFFRPLSRMVCGVFIISYTYASMSIVRHNMPVVLFGGIFATVPLLGVVMRYTIPPLFFVNYVGIVSRHRLCRSTNSYVPRCLVRAISVSADYSIFIRCSLFCDTLRNSPLSRPRDERAMTER